MVVIYYYQVQALIHTYYHHMRMVEFFIVFYTV